jgi:hypothetical protein
MGELVIYLFIWHYIMWLILEICFQGTRKPSQSSLVISLRTIMTINCLEHLSNTYKVPFTVCLKLISRGLCMLFSYVLYRFFICSYISQSMYCIRVTMTHGPKLSMHLTASNPRLFQTSLNGTMLIWQSKQFVSRYPSSPSILIRTLIVSGKLKAGFQLTLQRSPGPRKSLYSYFITSSELSPV